MLAISGGVGQHVPSAVCAKVVLMFSEHVKRVGKEGSLMRFVWPFKSPSSEAAGGAGTSGAQPGLSTWRQNRNQDLFVLPQTYDRPS